MRPAARWVFGVLSCEALARALRVAGKIEPVFVEQIADLPQAIRDTARDGDVLITMGAGSIGGVPGQLISLQLN